MYLRNFLFLDENTVSDYLSALEGLLHEGEIEQTRVDRTEKGGKAGAKIVEGNYSSESSTEKRERFLVSEAAKFQKLYSLLDDEDAVKYLDYFDDDYWSSLRRGDILEIQAELKIPQAVAWLRMAKQVTPFVDILQSIGHEAFEDQNAMNALKGMDALGSLFEEQPVPIPFNCPGTPKYSFLMKLPRKFIRCDIENLQGEATVFGKIQRIIPKRQKVEVFSLIPNFGVLPNMNKKQKRAMQKKMTNNEVMEFITGPALVISPVAIYR